MFSFFKKLIRISKSEDILKEIEDKINILNNFNKELEVKINNNSKILSNNEKTNQIINNNLNETNQNINLLNINLTDISKKVKETDIFSKELIYSNSQTEDKIKTLKEELSKHMSNFDKNINEISNKIGIKINEIEVIDYKILTFENDFTKTTSKLYKEIITIQENLETFNIETTENILNNNNNISVLKTNIDKTSENLENLNGFSKKLLEFNSQTEDKIKTLKDDLSNHISNFDKNINALSNKIGIKTNEIEVINYKIKTFENDFIKTTSELDNQLSNELDKVKILNKQIENTEENLENFNKKTTEDIESNNNRIIILKTNIDKTSEILENLNVFSKKLLELNNQTEDKIKTIKDDLSNNISNFDKNINELSNKIVIKINEIDEYVNNEKILLSKKKMVQKKDDVFVLTGNISIDENIIKNNIENGIFLLPYENNLFEYLENSDFNGTIIFNLKIAYQITFDFSVYIKNNLTELKEKECESIYDVLTYVRNKKNLKVYSLILDTHNKEILSNVIQQFIYLNINLEILLKSEYLELKILDYNINKLNTIQHKTNEQYYYLKDIKKMLYKFDAEKIKLLNLLANIKEKSNISEIKIAVMATKKSGKSVFVNNLLGKDYVLSSQELPTPNCCIYSKSKNNKIILEYNNEKIEFKDNLELKQYMFQRFKEAQLNQENGLLNDMKISYNNENLLKGNYKIIDTPGIDFAGANHRESGLKWIEEADIIFFLIDYGKYLTNDEENYLRQIKDHFEKNNKYHSLILVVNKTDSMFTSNEKKSVVRFLDYLRTKLNDLSYKNFVILGCSALTYFSANELSNIKELSELNNLEGDDLILFIRQNQEKYKKTSEYIKLSFTNDMLNNLSDFYGIDGTINTVKEYSKFPQLLQFTNNLLEKKIMNEKINLASIKISQYLSIIETDFSQEFKNELKEVFSKLKELNNLL